MNRTEFALTFTYWIVSSFFGIFGNVFVICLTQKYPSRIGISMVTVAFLKHLALADLFYSVTFVAMLFNDIYLVESGTLDLEVLHLNYPLEYNFFSTFNKIAISFNIVSYTQSIVLILEISIHRLYIIICPLKAEKITHNSVHMLSFVSLAVLSIHQISVIARNFEDNKCGIRLAFLISELCPGKTETPKFLDFGNVMDQIGMAINGIYILVYCIQVVLSISLLTYTVKYSLNKQRSARRPLTTTLSIAAIFVISWTPFIVWNCYMFHLRALVEGNKPIPRNAVSIVRQLEYFDYTTYSLSTYCNPIIYSLTIKKFRVAAKKQVYNWLGKTASTIPPSKRDSMHKVTS